MDPLVNHFDVLGLAACILCVVLAREVFVTVSFEQVLAVSRFRFFEFKVAHLLAKVLLIVFGFLFLRSFFKLKPFIIRTRIVRFLFIFRHF